MRPPGDARWPATGGLVLAVAAVLLLPGCVGSEGLTPEDRRSIAHRTFVVTGASSGFGRGVARKLAGHGANVVLAARRTEVLAEVAREVRAVGGTPLAVTTDVADPGDLERLAQAAMGRFGTIDAWINNAGVTAIGRFEEIPAADHGRVVDVNLKGVIYGSRAALRQFRAQGYGTLVNVGSLVGDVPLAYQATYSATKAGVLALGRALNEELRLGGTEAVRVATVMPWASNTPIWMHAANRTGREPCMPAMDHPRKVVDAIVRAALHPREEIYVGWKAEASAALHSLLPDTAEEISADVAHEGFIAKGRPAPKTAGALHVPMAEGTQVSVPSHPCGADE